MKWECDMCDQLVTREQVEKKEAHLLTGLLQPNPMDTDARGVVHQNCLEIPALMGVDLTQTEEQMKEIGVTQQGEMELSISEFEAMHTPESSDDVYHKTGIVIPQQDIREPHKGVQMPDFEIAVPEVIDRLKPEDDDEE